MEMKLMEMVGIVNETMGRVSELPEFEFCTCICMLLEEYCREHGMDVVELSGKLHKVIQEVNKDLGKY